MMLTVEKHGRGGNRLVLVLLILLSGVLAFAAQAQSVRDLSVEALRLQAEQGNADAQAELGSRYYNGRDGVAVDMTQALRWFRQAAEQGNARGQNGLGVVAQDYAESLRWFRLAAEQGYAYAQNNLGYRYARGQGVAQDYVEALRWYRLAVEQGNASAQRNLGLMYVEGQGVAPDDVEASRWFRLAADQGDAGGQLNLGAMYALGRGVAQDCAVAASYLQPLASKGNEDAISWMERLLTPAGDAKELPPHVQADLLEAQALDALQRGDYPVFLSSLCAFEALGHAERLTAQDRTELLYHRAVALRATGKPKAALMALNAYLKIADSSSDNYQPALLMLRPLQEEARK